MNLQVLVSTINQRDYSLLENMNIQSQAIVINQNSPLEQNLILHRDHQVCWYSFPERGIGKSRNIALMRSTAPICLFADDDVVYHDGYETMILKEFERNPRADVLIFNVKSNNPKRPEYTIRRYQRVHFYNCLRYGTFRLAVRMDRIHKKGIFFPLSFGGGCQYGSGEDSLFIMNCIRKDLKIYAVPLEIGTVTHSESTWFDGYTEKYFHDKGALFCAISEPFALGLCLQYCLRHSGIFTTLSFPQAFSYMMQGVKEYKNNYEKQ